jgi:hypothetical protein
LNWFELVPKDKRKRERLEKLLIVLNFFWQNSDIWAHGEVHLMDASLSGETRALLFAKGFLYSAHMDGSIKVSFLLHLDFCFCWWKWKGLLLAAHYRSLTSGFRV